MLAKTLILMAMLKVDMVVGNKPTMLGDLKVGGSVGTYDEKAQVVSTKAGQRKFI